MATVLRRRPFPIIPARPIRHDAFNLLATTTAPGQTVELEQIAAYAPSSWSVVDVDGDAAWTAAVLTAQVSNDGTTWYDVYDQYGAEWTCQLATDARRFVPLDIPNWASGRYVRFRSGTAATPVNQLAARTLYLLVRPV